MVAKRLQSRGGGPHPRRVWPVLADIFGFAASSLVAGRTDEAIKVLGRATKANPESANLLYTHAYSLLLEGKSDAATIVLRRGRANAKGDACIEACLTATEGMSAFRRGQVDHGRLLYQRATDDIRHQDLDRRLLLSAYANLAREEAIANTSEATVAGLGVVKVIAQICWNTVVSSPSNLAIAFAIRSLRVRSEHIKRDVRTLGPLGPVSRLMGTRRTDRIDRSSSRAACASTSRRCTLPMASVSPVRLWPIEWLP